MIVGGSNRVDFRLLHCVRHAPFLLPEHQGEETPPGLPAVPTPSLTQAPCNRSRFSGSASQRVKLWASLGQIWRIGTSITLPNSCVAIALPRIHRWTRKDGVRTVEGGEGVTGAMIRARIRLDGRLAGGLQALLGAPVAACSGCGERNGGTGTARGARGPGWRELAGTFSWPDVGTVADGRRQAGSGMARSRAGARVTFSCRGQRLGRCRVSRRAGRVSRPAREKNRRRSAPGGHGPFARTGPRGPTGQVMRHHLYCEPGGVGGEAPRGHVVQAYAVLEVSNGVPDPGVAAVAGLQFPASSSKVSPSRPVMQP